MSANSELGQNSSHQPMPATETEMARTTTTSAIPHPTLATAWATASKPDQMVTALTAAMPVAGWVEYQTGVPYVEELIEPRFKLDADGMLPVPTGPGLGVTLNPDAVAKFSRR